MGTTLRSWVDRLTGWITAVAQYTRSAARDRQRLQAILDAAGEGIVFTNRDMIIEYANPALERLTGYTRSEIIGQTPALWETDLTSLNTLAAGQPWHGETIFRRRDGTLYHVALTISPLQDEHAKIRGFVRVQHDITRQKELERLKSQWVARIGHELRTPLTNLIIYLTLLTDGNPEKHDQYLLILKHETDKLRRLIEGFTKMAELTADRTSPQWQAADLNQLVDDVVDRLRERFDRRHLQLRLERDPSLPPVMLDAELITDVLNQLLDNAVNYTPCDGYLTITTAAAQAAARSGVLISVRDSGPGIPPDELPTLFESFHRGTAAADFKTSGAGFGLAICQQIVALHHGRIDVDSQINQGSTFKVWLPLNPSG